MTHFYSFSSARLWLSLTLLCLSVTLATAQTIRYVKPVATGTGDGSSWANASGNLQRIIDRSAPDDQVWVAAGVYKPTRIPPGLDPTDERNKTFFFSNGVQVFGGFDGTETAIDQRDLTGPSSTTLSGEFGFPNTNTDNVSIVVTIRGSSKTILDGLIIADYNTGLFNDGSSTFSSQITGSQPTIRNCQLGGLIHNNTIVSGFYAVREKGGSKNSGATYTNCIINDNGLGIECLAENGICTPKFINCTISNNSTGMYTKSGSTGICAPELINCSISSNITDGSGAGGGAFMNQSSEKGIVDLKLTGCLISNNRGYYGAFATIGNYRLSLALTNCTIVDNVIAMGKFEGFFRNIGSVRDRPASVTIKNCLIVGNSTGLNGNQYGNSSPASVSYSIIPQESGLVGKSNVSGLDYTALFSNYAGYPTRFNTYQLSPTSPAVNAGDPNTNPKDLPATDLDGNPRFQGRIDIGAYERDVLPNRAPVALTHPDEMATVGMPMLIGGQEAYFVDPEDKPLTLTAMGLPANLSLVRNSAGSYTISGTPATSGVSSVTLIAKDPEGLSDTLTFQLVVDTAPVAFQLTAPVYDCQTGAFTFKTTGGDGSPIEYQATGITGWTANPNQYVDQGLRTANDVQPFTLMARQKGAVVSYTWNLKTACGRARVAASEATGGLSVKVLGNPIVGETAQVAISGADGQPLMLSLTDATGKVVSTERIEQATTETRTLRMGQSAGVYLLRASTPTQSWTVRVVKQ